MNQLIERYLHRAGTKYGTVLLLTLLIWFAVFLGLFIYAGGLAIVGAARVTIAAWRGTYAQIAMAAVLWVLILMLIPVVRGFRSVWREHNEQRYKAAGALTVLEEKLLPSERRKAYIENLQERLALHTLEMMEKKLLGEVQSEEMTLEERILELDRREEG